MLFRLCLSRSALVGANRESRYNITLTSKVIQEIGSSLGISVFLTNLRVNASSSNSTVTMTPGGVQVPIIRWCFMAVATARRK